MTGKNRKSSGFLLRFEIAMYFIGNCFASFGRFFVTKLAPAIDRALGGIFSKAGYMVLSLFKLESPRFMLISRFHASRMHNGAKVGISAISATAVVSIVVATILIGSQLVAVSVDGKVIGYLENEEQYAALVQSAKTKISDQTGVENTEIIIQDTNVSLEVVMAPQQEPLAVVAEPESVLSDIEAVTDTVADADGAGDDVVGKVAVDPGDSGDTVNGEGAGNADNATAGGEGEADNTVSAEGEGALTETVGEEVFVDTLIGSLLDDGAIKAALYTITVNGEEVASLATMIEASDVLKTIEEYYMPTEGEYTGKFLDDVVINGVTTEIEGAKAQSPEEVIDYLLNGKDQEVSYTAVEGDSIGYIAGVLGVDEQTLRDLYPGYDFEEMAAGSVFTATVKTPFIRYITEGTEVTYEPIDYVVIVQNTDELYLGQREIVEKGEIGELMLTHALVRINGEVISTEVIKEEVILEPLPERVLTGTKLLEAGEDPFVGPSQGRGGGGEGILGRPLNSWYLTRSIGGGHNGADMIAPRGTPIFAAAYGTVVNASLYSSYGNLVIIDHGNGLRTYYAHCDTFNTQVGDIVEKGQQIATVGITGYATAYHLHFEVRVNGAVQEPLNWIG